MTLGLATGIEEDVQVGIDDHIRGAAAPCMYLTDTGGSVVTYQEYNTTTWMEGEIKGGYLGH